ncbi:hypothetical protein A1O3_01946 [Capronia epimyces CBS 606.96]|uniref:rRNA adenine N(6)-methyltransferase n=1 Tax=Capronia epimyces CBS 606.96 TaxID=1182542 RepID=W9Y7S8_9EURO|nr:uncharacterized protein A1O3_01946 [Capronia epimyces CBS 606.96]EXJ88882.1 hypothetical protein A1O3_01946 [Capronia epimyces CBS 606.96]
MVIRYCVRRASTVANNNKHADVRISKPKGTPHTGRPRYRRTEITSEELCDDVVDRLRPTLPAPHTCDLIDINPGTGRWSRKLHAVLQPRRHVLVEPALPSYSDHLTPLLDAKNSKYRHASLLEDALRPASGLLSKHVTDQANNSTDLAQTNSSLLITANMSGVNLKTSNYWGTQSRKFFDDLYLSLWRTRSNIHRYGLVRLMVWIPDDEKDAYIPRTVSARRKQSVMLEASHHIVEVAGTSTHTKSTRLRRWPDLDLEDSAIVAAREEAAGSRTPASRRDRPPLPHLLSVEPIPKEIRKVEFTTDADWVPRFLELEQRLRRTDAAWFKKYGYVKYPPRGGLATADRRGWRELRRRARTAYNTHMKAVGLIKEERELISEWRKLLLSSADHSVEEKEEEQLKTRASSLDLRIKKLNRTNRSFAEKATDDCRAYDMVPPVMAWNRREAEPLIVQNGEFDPRDRPMALLDVTPRPEFLERIDTHDKMVCFGHVVRQLVPYFAKSVSEGLKTLVHESIDDFVATVPGIRDVTKGGWYDLSALRVRALPAEMFVEIALAYERWPFRQSTESILMLGVDPQAAYSLGEDE